MRKITILGLLIIFASFTFGQVKNVTGIKSAAKSDKMVKGRSIERNTTSSKATFLSEDFETYVTTEPALPTGWTTQKVDAYTQNTGIPQWVQDAWNAPWSCSVHISGETNSFVSSCSFFQTPGVADRWLFSPAVSISSSCVLSWKGRSINFGLQTNYGETYEVYVTNSIAGSAPRATDFPTGTRVYTTGTTPEEMTFTPRQVNVPYSSGTIYIAFRHTSNYKQCLAIDDVRVGSEIQNDLQVTETYLWNSWAGFSDLPYAYSGVMPKKQLDTVYMGQKYQNVGAATQTNCVLHASVNNGTNNVFTGASASTPSLAADAYDSVFVNGVFVAPHTSGLTYTVAYNLTQNETEETPVTNVDTLKFLVTDNAYSRALIYSTIDDITSWESQSPPITGGSGMMVGANYFFGYDDTISKIDISLYNGTTAGVVMTGKLFLVDGSTGDRIEVATTAAYTTSAISGATEPQVVDLDFITPYPVTAGSMVTAAWEVIYNAGMELSYLSDSESPNDIGSAFFFPSSSSWYWITNQLPHVAITTGAGAPQSVKENSSAFSIYPNPATSVLTLNLRSNQNSSVNVYNVLGAVVKSLNTSSLTNQIDISDLTAGVYTIQVSQNGQTTTQKFVKQ